MTWDDRQKKERYAIRGLHLKTDAIKPGEPVDLELRFSLVATAPAVTGDIGLKGTVMPDLEARRYRLSPFEGGAKLKGEGVPGGDVEIALEVALDLDLAADTAKLDGLEIRALGIEAQGDVAATRILERCTGAGRQACVTGPEALRDARVPGTDGGGRDARRTVAGHALQGDDTRRCRWTPSRSR